MKRTAIEKKRNAKSKVTKKSVNWKDIKPLQSEKCSFVTMSSIKKLITNQEALSVLDKCLCDGPASYGNNNRTLVSFDYIFDMIKEASTLMAKKKYFTEVKIALEKTEWNGSAQYIDLEN
jgi:hypothetical protein